MGTEGAHHRRGVRSHEDTVAGARRHEGEGSRVLEEREHGHVEGGGEMKRAGVGREEKIDTGDEGGEAGERLRGHDEHGAVGEAGELRGEVAFFGADEVLVAC